MPIAIVFNPDSKINPGLVEAYLKRTLPEYTLQLVPHHGKKAFAELIALARQKLPDAVLWVAVEGGTLEFGDRREHWEMVMGVGPRGNLVTLGLTESEPPREEQLAEVIHSMLLRLSGKRPN